ncbi:hypothetical protein GXM_07657 [Nostoc sphaeroides CCNUC1]|uniref:Uncharacterized protein n=1 Tax=Nostoc sphaeroides CCNUC1 TaxID=2653204 RepID=A0A5P8WBJ8_9NOSO|nr:hypothetical protein GXM_07657 [Nostoc sphaeroides CCNUC1]
MVNYAPAPALASEFGVVFDYDLAHFADLVSVRYLGSQQDFNVV